MANILTHVSRARKTNRAPGAGERPGRGWVGWRVGAAAGARDHALGSPHTRPSRRRRLSPAAGFPPPRSRAPGEPRGRAPPAPTPGKGCKGAVRARGGSGGLRRSRAQSPTISGAHLWHLAPRSRRARPQHPRVRTRSRAGPPAGPQTRSSGAAWIPPPPAGAGVQGLHPGAARPPRRRKQQVGTRRGRRLPSSPESADPGGSVGSTREEGSLPPVAPQDGQTFTCLRALSFQASGERGGGAGRCGEPGAGPRARGPAGPAREGAQWGRGAAGSGGSGRWRTR